MIDELMQRENYVVAKKLLDVAHMRQEAIASNLANVETPGYKRQDVDAIFETQLRRLAKGDDVQGIGEIKARMITDLDSPSVRADGNNVQIDQELLRMQKNAVQYEFLANYTSNSLKQLMTAVTGRV